jgi:aldose 1-epimerase
MYYCKNLIVIEGILMITKQHFGKTSTNKEVFLYTISYKRMQVCVSTFGAAIVSIIIPDKKNSPCDVVLGYDDVSGYEKQDTYIGSAIGRCLIA